jgi:hypothetical protein
MKRIVKYVQIDICVIISYPELSMTWRYFIATTMHKTEVGLKLAGTHHVLAYADDMNLLVDNIIL